LGFLVLFGSPLLMLYAMDAFPTLDPNASLLLIVALPVLVLSWGLCAIYRKNLFPWGSKAPFIMWAGTLGFAVLPTMLAIGLALMANGAFDRSSSVEHKVEVRGRRSKDHSVRVAARSFPTIRIWVQLTRNEFYHVQRGDSLRLFVRGGALGTPWIESYSLR
jgi:hypothetical protein